MVKKKSLQGKIFSYMLLTTVVSFVLVMSATLYQYNLDLKNYHLNKLSRKETALKRHINYIVSNNIYFKEGANIDSIFSDKRTFEFIDSKIKELSSIHSLEFSIQKRNGDILISSSSNIDKISKYIENLPDKILSSDEGSFILKHIVDDVETIHSHSFIENVKNEKRIILSVYYRPDNTEQFNQLKDSFINFTIIYLIVFVVASFLAYVLSGYTTKSIVEISKLIGDTSLDKPNQKILLDSKYKEFNGLIDAYNSMIDKLRDSAIKLSESERKQAWKEMAKQVAHEIKNPLTPMRLSIQSFVMNFDSDNMNIEGELNDLCSGLIEQIDLMSSIASAFSDFAQMPVTKTEMINVNNLISSVVNLFNTENIYYNSDIKDIFITLDKNQFIRIITNLVKNAIDATEETVNSKVKVKLFDYKEKIIIEVIDNGAGISKDMSPYIFTPKFTTKTKGSGLGLAMIKNIIESYSGEISYVSIPGKETIFTVVIPKK